MSFVKLDPEHQECADSFADSFYDIEKEVLRRIQMFASNLHPRGNSTRWLSIGTTDIEKGFMALRKAVTLNYVEEQEKQDTTND